MTDNDKRIARREDEQMPTDADVMSAFARDNHEYRKGSTWS